MLEALRRLGLLKAPAVEGPVSPPPQGDAVERPAGRASRLSLPRLCGEGALEGGLSVALDVRPDELFGALAAAAGGAARRLKVLDVRDRPSPQMVVQGAGEGEGAETWDVPDLASLVERLNERMAADPGARLTAVLGEWDGALQLWCLPRKALRELLRERAFRPENLAELRRLATA